MFLFTHFVKRFLVVLVHRKSMFSSERSDTLAVLRGSAFAVPVGLQPGGLLIKLLINY